VRVVGDRCLDLVFRLSFTMEVEDLAQVWYLLLCGDYVLILVLMLVVSFLYWFWVLVSLLMF